MEPNRLDSTQEMAGNTCDESKCVSRGRSDLYGGSFTCYGDDGAYFPRMCADGFLPIVVEDEPSYFAAYGNDNVTVNYFTCCPPDAAEAEATRTTVTRRCSDPVVASPKNDVDALSEICNGQGAQKHPIWMKKASSEVIFGSTRISGITTEAAVCCDSTTNSNSDAARVFLEQSACVPYRNRFYDAGKVAPNQHGKYSLIECELEDFSFPRPLSNGTYDEFLSTRQYECCKTGPSLPPYIHDKVFHTESFVTLFLFVLAAIASGVVAVGISIPLLRQLKNGSYPGNSRQRRIGSGPSFSSFNLYLVYLAIPDLVFSLLMIINKCGAERNQMWFGPYFFSGVMCFNSICNLLLYTIVLHQVVLLLQNRQSAQRINPPSLSRITLQAGAVYSIGIVTALVCRFTLLGNHALLWQNIIHLPVFGAPLIYAIHTSIKVHRRGYLQFHSTTVGEKSLRNVSIFFLRTVAVFFGHWVICITLGGLAINTQKPMILFLFWLVNPIQFIATNCIVLTKADTRKAIVDLLTLSHLFEEGCICNKNSECSDPDSSPGQETADDNDRGGSDGEGTQKVPGQKQSGDDATSKTVLTLESSSRHTCNGNVEDAVANNEELEEDRRDIETGLKPYSSKRVGQCPIMLLPTGEMVELEKTGET